LPETERPFRHVAHPVSAPSAHELRGTGRELSVIGMITALGDIEAPGRWEHYTLVPLTSR
jgi:hypothetical protein